MNTDNKLIAEFMGLGFSYRSETMDCDFYYTPEEFRHFYERHQNEISPIEMMYDESWDWLMPVVEKIEEDVNTSTEIAHRIGHGNLHTCTILSSNNQIDITEWSENKLVATYKAVVKYIKQYNEQ